MARLTSSLRIKVHSGNVVVGDRPPLAFSLANAILRRAGSHNSSVWVGFAAILTNISERESEGVTGSMLARPVGVLLLFLIEFSWTTPRMLGTCLVLRNCTKHGYVW